MSFLKIWKLKKKHLLRLRILIPYLILSVVGLIVVYSTTSARLVTLGANPSHLLWTKEASGCYPCSLFSSTDWNWTFSGKISFWNCCYCLWDFTFWSLPNFPPGNQWCQWLDCARSLVFQPAEYLSRCCLVWPFSKKQSAIERYDYQALTKNRWIPRNGKELMTGVSICLVWSVWLLCSTWLGECGYHCIDYSSDVFNFWCWLPLVYGLICQYCRDFNGLPRLNCLGWGSNHG